MATRNEIASRTGIGAPQARKGSFWRFLLFLALAVFFVRSFLFAPFNIPSESMQPRLLIGDYLIVDKTAYGWSRYSLLFDLLPFEGRLFGRLPERGDIVVFKAPPGNDTDYIKRVIGLPGDRVAMKDGALFLNGTSVARTPLPDFVIPVTENMRQGSAPCFLAGFQSRDAQGEICRYRRFQETLPNGKSYETLDLMDTVMDTTGVYIVPPDHVFLLGDNRDRSMDSRFPAVKGGGIGMVSVDNLVGRAQFTFFSTDGSASWLNPLSWGRATRWSRIGEGF